MENSTYKSKMLGLVTLYSPDPQEAVGNIKKYIYDVDSLIIWDNSPLEKNLKKAILSELADVVDKVVWKGDGRNYFIAPAINFALHYAKENAYDLLLIMDQDSQWEAFSLYRQQIERHLADANSVFTPYVAGNDNWIITKQVHERRVFINSGTVIPVSILSEIDGADEAFPLDALDFDMSYRILKANYHILCLTCCVLYHTVGQPHRTKILRLYTNNYGRERTYSITKGQVMNYRRHKDIMTAYEKRKFFKEIFMWKIIRMILVEDDKIGRFRMFFKGIVDGITYKLK